MKKAIKIITCLTVILSLLLFAACSKDGGKDASTDGTDGTSDISAELSSEESAELDEKLISTWYVEEHSLTFKEDGTGVVCKDGEFIPLDWEIKGGKLVVISDDISVFPPVNESYSISEDGKSLTIGEKVYSNEPIEALPDEGSELVGTWYNYGMMGEETTVFNADGTGSMTSMGVEMEMTWKVENGVLTMEVDAGGLLTTTMTADSYKLEGETLTIVIDGEEGVFSKTRRTLGGNPELCGTWIEPNAELDADGYPMYNYSLDFSSKGTGSYTDEEYNVYSFIWEEADGKLNLEVYELDDDMNEKLLASVEASYSIDSDNGVLTITSGDKSESFEFYEEEFDFDFGPEVDTEHALGGDDKLVGEWTLSFFGELSTVTFTEDGTYSVDSEDMQSVSMSWYVEDGYLMTYMESFGITVPLQYGDYKVEGDLLTIMGDGSYTVLARKGSEYAGFDITVFETEELAVDPEYSKIYKEADGSEYIELAFTEGVKDCKFVSYTYSDDAYTSAKALYEIPQLTEEEVFVACTTIDPEISLRGISFTAENGENVNLVIKYNEESEIYEFEEIDYSIQLA